jgi:hypothetical protein
MNGRRIHAIHTMIVANFHALFPPTAFVRILIWLGSILCTLALLPTVAYGQMPGSNLPRLPEADSPLHRLPDPG